MECVGMSLVGTYHQVAAAQRVVGYWNSPDNLPASSAPPPLAHKGDPS
jgi:hypothetical protein